MGKLVIVIPFDEANDSDLKRSAIEMQTFFNGIENHRLGDNIGAEVDEIRIIYAENDCMCTNDDYVILFAHGGDDTTELSDNVGGEITMDNAIAKLDRIAASNCVKALFMACYSANEGHIARIWRATYNQDVYGGDGVIANLYSSTRTQIRAVCAALNLL